MRHTLSNEQVRRLRLRSQRLDPAGRKALADPAQVVAALCSVQAQEAPAAALALRPRGDGLTAAEVETARIGARSIVRTWAMRGTLHLLAAEDVGWMLALFGPLYIARGKRRYAELGLDDAKLTRGVAALRETPGALGPQTRAEIVERLAGQGIRLEGQAEYHLLHHAGLLGVLCHGPEREGEPTYVLLEGWVNPGRSLARDEALAEIARRYLAAYGPATLADFAGWTGLPMTDARAGWRAIGDEVVEIEVAGEPAALRKEQAVWLDERELTDPSPDDPVVNLLPRFDTYLLGYRRRDLAVPAQFSRRIHPGGGMLSAALLVDGCAAGTWRIAPHRRNRQVTVVVQPFAPLAQPVKAKLRAEVADVGRFLGVESVLQVQEE